MSKTIEPTDKGSHAVAPGSDNRQELAAAVERGASIQQLIDSGANREGDAYEQGARILGAGAVKYPPAPPHAPPAGVFINGLPAGSQPVAQGMGIPVDLSAVIGALHQYEQKIQDVTVRVVLTPSSGVLLDGGEGDARHGNHGTLIFIGDAGSVIEELSHVTLVADGSGPAEIGIGVTPIIPTAGGDSSQDAESTADADSSDLAPFFARLSVSAGDEGQSHTLTHILSHESSSGESLFSQDTTVTPLAGVEGGPDLLTPVPEVTEISPAPGVLNTVIAPQAPVPLSVLTASLVPPDHAPTGEILSAQTVAENAPNGTVIGTLTTTDPDQGDHFTYSLKSQDTPGMFAVNASTGVVTVADSSQIDYESAISHTITVRTTDSGGLTFDKQFTIDVTDVAPGAASDTDGAANSVIEGAVNGTAVGLTAQATDPHGGTVTYSLADDAGGRFVIDGSTGVVTVADGSQLDYQASNSHVITVRASDPSGLYTDTAFTIAVTDVAPGTPTDTNVAANSVSEGATNGATVGITAQAVSHGGALTYSLAGQDTAGLFTIDAATGVVTVADATKLDYDTSSSQTITVRASDLSGAHADQNFSISVSQVALTGITDSNGATNSVSEGASNGAVVGLTALATNPHGDAVSYSLTNTAGGAFTIDASTGIVTVADATKLSYDTASSMTVGVRATEASGQHADQNFTVNIGQVALTGITDNDGTANSVSEGASNGAAVDLTALATNPHSDAVTYSLTNTAGGAFTIDATTGIVTVADATRLSYDSSSLMTVGVRATEASGQHADQNFTVAIGQVALTGITDNDGTANSVSEGASNGATVGLTALATNSHSDAVTYSLTNTASGAFTIDAATGIVSVADSTKLSYDTSSLMTVGVRATEASGQHADQNFTVSIGQVALTGITDSNAAANSVSEGASNGAAVGLTALATNPHGDSVVYSLTNTDGGAFAIDASTGVVTVADATKLNYDTASLVTVGVRATEGSGQHADQNFSINIGQVALTGITDSNGTANSVSEGASNGATVGLTALATNPHGDAVVYSLTNNAGGAFTIDASTGIVSVADVTKLSYDTSSLMTLGVRASEASGQHVDQNFTVNIAQVALTGITDSNAIANSVSEGASNGATVGVTALATNPHGDAVAYSLTNTAGGAFTIDASTGIVSVADSTKLSYDTASLMTVGVRATEASGQHADQNFSINVSQVALTGITDSNGAANSVSEGASNGATVGVTALATNPHGDAVTYSLTNTAGGAFTIDASTGIVSVADATKLNYDTSSLMTVGVRATEASGQHADQNFTVNIGQVALTGITDNDGTANSVSEGASNGVTVGLTALATNPHGDAVSYSLTSNAGGAFTIDASTGIVTVADATKLNYDTASSLTVGVRATEASGQHADQNFTVSVSQVGLTGITDSNAAANVVSEGASNGAAVGLTALATNPHGDVVVYSLTSTAGGAFTIDASTGIVTVADSTKLNYDTASSITVSVRATEASGQHADQNFTVAIGQVALTGITDNDGTANSVSEGASNGATVGLTALATNPHGDAVVYNLTNTAGGAFTIDASTGIVTVADSTKLNYDTASSMTVGVRATEASGQHADQNFMVNIAQVALTGITDSDGTANGVAWGVAGGAATGLTAHATNPHGDAVTYSLTASDGGAFTIDSSTGVVTVADPTKLNAATTPNPTITVRATEASGQHVDQNFTISVTDDAPTTTGPADAKVQTAAGTTAVSYDAHGLFADTDTANGDALHYSYVLNSADSSATMPGWLTFNTSTGVFSGTATAGYNADLNFSVTATDSAGQSVSTTADLGFGNFATTGTAGGDTISGTAVYGDAGADIITATAGSATFFGGAGNDTVNIGDTSKVYGGSGDDSLYGTVSAYTGSDTFYGGSGNDTIVSSSYYAADMLYGGSGNDSLVEANGNRGSDTMYGGSGADTFAVNHFSAAPFVAVVGDFSLTDGDVLQIKSGNDGFSYGTPDAGQLQATVIGGNTYLSDPLGTFEAELQGFTGTLTSANVVFVGDVTGSSGNNTLGSSGSNQDIVGLAGNDSITNLGGGYDLSNTIDGGAGNDTIVDNSFYSTSTLFGGTGDDSIADANANGRGQDMMYGGAGNDTLSSAGVSDTMTGGSGEDVFKFTAAHSGSIITDFNQANDGDLIDLTTWTSMNFRGTSAFSGSVHQVDYSQSGGNTIVYVDTNGDNVADFHFQLTGLYTLSREDFIFNGDKVGTSGNDTLSGSGHVFGLAGNDSLTASGASNTVLVAGNGHDTLSDGGFGGDTLVGGGGGDSLVSTGFNNLIKGGNGADTISSYGNGDTLTGGHGADTFVFNHTPGGTGSTLTDMSGSGGDGDHIALSNSVFNFASGPIAQGTGLNDNTDIYQVSSAFGGGKFMDVSHSETFLYDNTNGHVWYEQDTSHNAVLVATIQNFATYTYHAADFVGWS